LCFRKAASDRRPEQGRRAGCRIQDALCLCSSRFRAPAALAGMQIAPRLTCARLPFPKLLMENISRTLSQPSKTCRVGIFLISGPPTCGSVDGEAGNGSVTGWLTDSEVGRPFLADPVGQECPTYSCIFGQSVATPSPTHYGLPKSSPKTDPFACKHAFRLLPACHSRSFALRNMCEGFCG